jgi:hypothetical protein
MCLGLFAGAVAHGGFCYLACADPLFVGDLEHLVAFFSAGGADLDAVAFFLADQGARDGRLDVEKALFNVGFHFADDLPGFFLVGVFVDKGDGGAELDRAGERGRVDDIGQRNRAFEFLDAALDKALLFAGRVILGVFLEVAKFTRRGDGLDDGGAFDRLQMFQFRFQR